MCTCLSVHVHEPVCVYTVLSTQVPTHFLSFFMLYHNYNPHASYDITYLFNSISWTVHDRIANKYPMKLIMDDGIERKRLLFFAPHFHSLETRRQMTVLYEGEKKSKTHV